MPLGTRPYYMLFVNQTHLFMLITTKSKKKKVSFVLMVQGSH